MTAEHLSETRFLTVDEVARAMRLSRMTVYRMVHSHELAAVRFGRSFRVPESAVKDFIEHAAVKDLPSGPAVRRGHP